METWTEKHTKENTNASGKRNITNTLKRWSVNAIKNLAKKINKGRLIIVGCVGDFVENKLSLIMGASVLVAEKRK